MQLTPTQDYITPKPNNDDDQNNRPNSENRGVTVPESNTKSQRATFGTDRSTKVQSVIALMRRKKGATISELVTATGWQQHSIRGLISGTIKKKLLFNVATEKGGKSGTRYRIEPADGATS